MTLSCSTTIKIPFLADLCYQSRWSAERRQILGARIDPWLMGQPKFAASGLEAVVRFRDRGEWL